MPLSLIFSDDVVDSRPYTDVITVMTLSTHVLTLMLLFQWWRCRLTSLHWCY